MWLLEADSRNVYLQESGGREPSFHTNLVTEMAYGLRTAQSELEEAFEAIGWNTKSEE